MRLYEQIRENVVKAGKYRQANGYIVRMCFNCSGRGYFNDDTKIKTKRGCGWCFGSGKRWIMPHWEIPTRPTHL